jgi:outer membrane protein assembly factor BamB
MARMLRAAAAPSQSASSDARAAARLVSDRLTAAAGTDQDHPSTKVAGGLPTDCEARMWKVGLVHRRSVVLWQRESGAGRRMLYRFLVAVGLAAVASLVPLRGTAPVGAAAAQVSGVPTYTWPKIAHDPSNTGVSADPAISTGNASSLGVRWMSATGGTSVSSPVVAWNAALGRTLVYIGNEVGYLTAYDEATGQTVWSVDLGSSIRATPLVEGGSIWVARTFSPYLYKLDAATGALQCSRQLVSEADSSLTIGTPPGGPTTIYAAVADQGPTTSGPVYAINETNCSTEWKFTNFNSPSGTWTPLSFGTDKNGRSLLLFGSADPDQTVYAVDAGTGTKVWSFKTPSLAGNLDDDVGSGVSITAPGVNGFPDGVAYVPSEDGWAFALDLTTGSPLWQHDYGTGLPQLHLSRSTPAIAGDLMIFGESGGVMCLNAITGAQVWAYSTGALESLSAAAVVGPPGQQVVAMSTVGGAIDVLDVATGALLYQYQTGGFSISSVADVDGNLLAGSADGFLYDLARGGGNGAHPSTVITSPANSQALTNPMGSLSVTGTATANGTPGNSGGTVGGVNVAVQSGGPNGPWWDATAQTWTAGYFDNAATLTTPGAASTGWTLSLPIPTAGGSFTVLASAVQANGIADISAASSNPGGSATEFSVRNAAGSPRVYAASGIWVAPGAKLTVAGTGFQPGETVTLTYAGTTLGSATATGGGALPPTSVVMPVTAAFGPSSISAKGGTSGWVGQARVDVSNSWVEAGYGQGVNAEPNDEVLLHLVAPGLPTFLTQAWSYPDGAAVRTSIALSHDVAYFADDAGRVTALDVYNAEPLWTTTAPSAVDSTPALSGTLMFFGTEGGSTAGPSVVALRTTSGTQTWSTPTSSAVESSPAVSGQQLYVGSDDGTVYDMNTKTGTIAWQTRLAGSVKGAPVVDAATGLVFVGDSSGAVSALSSTTGHVTWSFQTGGPVTATPSLYNGKVYVGSADGHAYALTETDGGKIWEATAHGHVSTGGVVFSRRTGPTDYVVGSDAGNVTYLTLGSGKSVKVTNLGARVAGLAAAQGFIAATTSNDVVWGLKRFGEALWSTTVNGGFASAPIVADGVVYTTGLDQTVRAYTAPGSPIP